jgi:hypothetical protein
MGSRVMDGVVESVTPDDQILWLAAHFPRPRTMIERAEGFAIWISYKWERAEP